VKALLTLCVLTVAGCVSVDPNAGFDDVRRIAEERTGGHVEWIRDSPEDARVADAVHELLAKELTADAAVQVALLNNHRLRGTYAELGIAQAALVQAGLLENPVFDAAVRYPASGGRPEIDLGVVQNFLSILWLPMRRGVAEAEFEATKLRVTAAVVGLATTTRAAYFDLQGDMQLLGMRRHVLEAAEASADFMRALHDAGNVRDLDVDVENTALEAARIDVETSERMVAGGRERMQGLMGLWGFDTAWTIPDRLPDVGGAPSPAESEARAVAASLDLAAARFEIEAQARRLGLAESTSLVPSLDAGASAERREGWDVGPSLSGQIPIFDQGQARRAGATSELLRRREDYLATAVEIRSEARAAASDVAAARNTVVRYRDGVLPLEARIVEESQLEYNAMQIGVFQLLAAKRHEIEAGQRSIEALQDYWVSRTHLDGILQGRRAGALATGAHRTGSASGGAAETTGGH
jgi:cobalt-zinc-cadmium efflux system outer membrane protein